MALNRGSCRAISLFDAIEHSCGGLSVRLPAIASSNQTEKTRSLTCF